MKNQFNKDNLEKLGIFELRNIAREVGVHSPTIYKKEELIVKIIAIVTGEAKPHVAKTKQGRPAKSINSINNILEIFIPRDEFHYQAKEAYEPFDQFASLSSISAMQNSLDLQHYGAEEHKFEQAVLEVAEEGYGFAYEKGYRTNAKHQNFFIPNNYVKNHNLKSGDMLCGFAREVSKDKPMVAYKLEKINGVSFEVFNTERKNFNSSIAVHPSEKILLKNTDNNVNKMFINKIVPIGKGQRVVIFVSQNTDYSPLIIDYLNDIKESEKLQKYCILIDERPEDVTEYLACLKGAGVSISCTSQEEAVVQSIQKIELIVERAKRSVEDGKDVVLVISNLNRLQNFYKKHNSMLGQTNYEQDNIQSIMMIKRLLMSARSTQDMGSFTIMAIVETSNNNIEFLNALRDSSNTQLYVKEKNFPNRSKLWFDLINSQTRKSDLLLSKEESQFADEFYYDLTEENLEEKTLELESILQKTQNN